ncbi:MAG TPA: amidase [Bryobacteraceae bacterium]|nr:amidase [Bryobacteraceae bacterium]
MTVAEAAQALRSGQISSSELTEGCLNKIDKLNPQLNAFITVTPEIARRQAAQADAELHAGQDRGPLHGIPIAHKDLLCTLGVRTTSGSKIFADYVPDFDATAVERLAEAGAVMLGKTGLHEHACGVTCNNPHFGPIRNPWDPSRIPGGSSGGSAVAVATGMALAATGSDTGGSIRIPAHYCGVTGFKGTFGLVSKYGALPLAFSLDHVGPITQTILDSALMLEILAGHDPKDPSSVRRPKESFVPAPEDPAAVLKSIHVLLPRNFFFEKIDTDVKRTILLAAQNVESAGATFVMGAVPDVNQLNAVANLTFAVEAAAVHEPYLRKRRASYGADVASNVDIGRAIPATAYVQAQRLRTRFQQVWRMFLDKADCILTPVCPIAAPPIGQNTVDVASQLEDVRVASTRLLRGINALGFPAAVIRAGYTPSGLPVGLQLIGRPFGDAQLLRIAHAFETALGVERLTPPDVS